MATVFDVADYILHAKGPMTAMKLQKLLYYCQAWSLVWDETPLFDARIEAWANGPVVQQVYSAHRGEYQLSPDRFSSLGSGKALNPTQKETVDAVLEHYADKTSAWLSDLTHKESPWTDARKGLEPGERSSREISHAAMAEYYGSL